MLKNSTSIEKQHVYIVSVLKHHNEKIKMLCVSDKENERNQGKPALMKLKFTGVCTFTCTLLAD